MDEGEQAKIKRHHKWGEYGESVIIVRHYVSSHAVCTLYSVGPSLDIPSDRQVGTLAIDGGNPHNCDGKQDVLCTEGCLIQAKLTKYCTRIGIAHNVDSNQQVYTAL